MIPSEKPPSWSGLLGCLSVGALVIALIVGGFLYIKKRQDKIDDRITAEFLNPYLAALRANDPATVWKNLTTESYRQRHTQEAHAANFRLALEKLGQAESVRIFRVTSTHEPERSFQRVRARWKFAKSPEFLRTHKLIDVPGQGFRLDESNLDALAPANVPPDPW